MKIFRNHADCFQAVAPHDVLSGGLLVKGDFLGVAQADAQTGELVGVLTTGVFELPITAGGGLELGDAVYLDAATRTLTATGGGVSTGGSTGPEGKTKSDWLAILAVSDSMGADGGVSYDVTSPLYDPRLDSSSGAYDSTFAASVNAYVYSSGGTGGTTSPTGRKVGYVVESASANAGVVTTLVRLFV